MTEQEIREIVEGHGLETCVGGYDELVSALHQKFEEEINAEVRQAWDNARGQSELPRLDEAEVKGRIRSIRMGEDAYPSYKTLLDYIDCVSKNYERYIFNYDDGWAIINLEYLNQLEKLEYDKDKVKVIKENRTLKRKLREITDSISDLEEQGIKTE